MADQNGSNILREYLVALGFKVDAVGNKRFGNTLSSLDKGATRLSRSIVGVGVAAQAMTTEFAFRMEKLFYSSKLAESAAANLQALSFGGKQIGIANITEQVQSLARALRANPGLTGLLNSLGVKVEGRDKADVLTDLVAQLKKMPFYIAQRYASMFGIDPDTLLLLQQGLDKMKEAKKLREDAAREMGVDTEDAVKAGLEYAQQWREILMYVGLFRDALAITMTGPMKELAGATKEVLRDWITLVSTPRKSAVDDLQVSLGLKSPSEGVALKPDAAARTGDENIPYKAPEGNKGLGKYLERFFRWRERRGQKQRGEGVDPAAVDAATEPDRLAIQREAAFEKNPELKKRWAEAMRKGDYKAAQEAVAELDRLNGITAPVAPAAPPPPLSKGERKGLQQQSLMERLEEKYALPTGLLDRIWQKESARGKYMLSPKGAQGHFGFMPATAKEYGVKDPNDFRQSADGAARKMADLLKRYGGDLRLAAAAYNWGEGNLDRAMLKAMEKNPGMGQEELDRYVLGTAPKETRDYVNSVAGDQAAAPATTTINQETNIHVHETGDARSTADAVAEQQRAVNADMVRKLTPRIQ